MDTIEIVQLIYTFWLRNKNEYSRLCLTINNSCEVKSHLCIANNIWRIQHLQHFDQCTREKFKKLGNLSARYCKKNPDNGFVKQFYNWDLKIVCLKSENRFRQAR